MCPNSRHGGKELVVVVAHCETRADSSSLCRLTDMGEEAETGLSARLRRSWG